MKDLRRLPGDGLLSFSPELAYEMELAQQRREILLQLSLTISDEIDQFGLLDSPRDALVRLRRLGDA